MYQTEYVQKILNKEEIESSYECMSTKELSFFWGISYSTAVFLLKKHNIPIKTKSESYSVVKEKMGLWLVGKNRIFSKEHKKKISLGKLGTGKGYSIKKDGIIQYTAGENKHRSQHVIVMENFLGRRLRKGECVHHIDRNKSNNKINNLTLLTWSAHARLHRFEDMLEGKSRDRNEKGEFI